MAYQAPKGTKDILPSESYKWQYLEEMIRRTAAKYGFSEARTPIFEHTELFLRGIGDTTDVVQKEMYTFLDKGDRSITLRPEGTAGMARMFLEHALYNEALPIKTYYLSAPVFRYERPQAGRLREHHQFGVEYYGSPNPSADAECILLALDVLRQAGCADLSVCLNNIGCPNCRPKYQEALKSYLEGHKDELCETCKTRFDKNPLRILDCKTPHCIELSKDAPLITDYVCDDCRAHFEKLLKLLDAEHVDYKVVPTIVRGLDYYTKTVFEIVSNSIGAQGTVCGGGRYDGLVSELGGPAIPAVGFGLGMERLLLLMQQLGSEIPAPKPADVYIASIGDDAYVDCFTLCADLRALGVHAESDQMGRSTKAQFKYADKIKARFVLTVGDNERAAGEGKLKRLSDGTEIPVQLTAKDIQMKIMGEE